VGRFHPSRFATDGNGRVRRRYSSRKRSRSLRRSQTQHDDQPRQRQIRLNTELFGPAFTGLGWEFQQLHIRPRSRVSARWGKRLRRAQLRTRPCAWFASSPVQKHGVVTGAPLLVRQPRRPPSETAYCSASFLDCCCCCCCKIWFVGPNSTIRHELHMNAVADATIRGRPQLRHLRWLVTACAPFVESTVRRSRHLFCIGQTTFQIGPRLVQSHKV
jgi:hypothetical protein